MDCFSAGDMLTFVQNGEDSYPQHFWDLYDDLADFRNFGDKRPRSPPHEDEWKKIPNQRHYFAMQEHVHHRDHKQCYAVWSGAWGAFIGGTEGRQYFDLTACTEGKLLKSTAWLGL